MDDIALKLKNGRGAFFVEKNGARVAEMVIDIQNENLTVYHTEVDETLKGTGLASKLVSEMAAYAREHKLKVIPRCAYVQAQFNRHPEMYMDIWNKTGIDKKH